MRTLKFKTNINCKGCVEKVQPYLDKEEDIHKWDVDISSSNKTLTVNTEALSANDIVNIVKAAGFQAEEKTPGLFAKLFK